MLPYALFQYCPRCGVALARPGQNPLQCQSCGLRYFFNPTCAAAGFCQDGQGNYLFIRRAKEPARGKLAVPGGFIDIGETAEEALRRETREEVGVELTNVRYLLSCTNEYFYGEVLYPVVDLIFTAQVLNPESARPLDAVAGIEWNRIENISESELAFPSLKAAWHALKE